MKWSYDQVAEPSAAASIGVTWDGSLVLFSRPSANEILGYDPNLERGMVFRRHTGGVTGLATGPDLKVYACQTPSRRIVTYDVDGTARVLADQLGGQYHNFPRYIDIDARGRVWFADPRLEITAPGPHLFPLLDHASILRLDRVAPGSWSMKRMTFDTQAPSVITMSTSGDTVYVVDTSAGGQQVLISYPVLEDDTLGERQVLATLPAMGEHPPISGMCVDTHGNLVIAGYDDGPALRLITADGQWIERIPIPEVPTDVVFGGTEGNVALYFVTLTGALFRMIGIDDI